MHGQNKYLFIHQNFLSQFVHLVTELVRLGHEVVALGVKGCALLGLRYLSYESKRLAKPSEVDAARDFEVKVMLGIACAMEQLKNGGFTTDIIVAHPGWGESLFCKDVWPRAKLIIFAKFFYSASGADYNFDAEFMHDSIFNRARLRLKNSVHLKALHATDRVYTPTQWQLSQLPVEYHHKTQVIFDGIDIADATPVPQTFIQLKRDNLRLSSSSEVITFVNRNLEPYRGFHVFMRVLPQILKHRPNAHCLIVGQNDVSYGAKPNGGGSWRDLVMAEVGAQLPMDRIHSFGAL